jgi:hypothetical protein
LQDTAVGLQRSAELDGEATVVDGYGGGDAVADRVDGPGSVGVLGGDDDAAFAGAAPGTLTVLVAKMTSEFALQRGLQHPLRQLLQQAAFPSELHPA